VRPLLAGYRPVFSKPELTRDSSFVNSAATAPARMLRTSRMRARIAHGATEERTDHREHCPRRTPKAGLQQAHKQITIEEQKSQNETVKRLMRQASKSGGGGVGSPEFIISAAIPSDFLIIIECKASHSDHISKPCKTLLGEKAVEENDEAYTARVKRFGVDGVLHYAKHLSREFNVIAVAVCGESIDSCVISAYLHAKEGSAPTVLKTKDGEKVDGLLPWDDFIEHATFDPAMQKLRHDELIAFSRDLHDFMRDHAKLAENEKPLLVSGTLIALPHGMGTSLRQTSLSRHWPGRERPACPLLNPNCEGGPTKRVRSPSWLGLAV
jgi:hypothetical protein